MSGIESHQWGESLYAGKVWSRVAGMAPSRAHKVQFMVLQAYIDESYNEGGLFVLAGYIASVEAWANFSKEWEELLPFATLSNAGTRSFHMVEMMKTVERQARILPFYKVIHRHAITAVSTSIYLTDLKKAINAVEVTGITLDWLHTSDPYYFCFRAMMDSFHERRNDFDWLLPTDERVDFIFDKNSMSRPILEAWNSYVDSIPDNVKPLFSSQPIFENDEEYLPLQAADFFAWVFRASNLGKVKPVQIYPDNIPEENRVSIPVMSQHITYEKCRDALVRIARKSIVSGQQIVVTNLNLDAAKLFQSPL